MTDGEIATSARCLYARHGKKKFAVGVIFWIKGGSKSCFTQSLNFHWIKEKLKTAGHDLRLLGERLENNLTELPLLKKILPARSVRGCE